MPIQCGESNAKQIKNKNNSFTGDNVLGHKLGGGFQDDVYFVIKFYNIFQGFAQKIISSVKLFKVILFKIIPPSPALCSFTLSLLNSFLEHLFPCER